jgi:hypothetical protein
LAWVAACVLALTGAPTHAVSAPSLPVEEIVRRTVDAMDRPAPHLVCTVRVHKQVFDGDGKPEEDERSDFQETRQGDRVDWNLERRVKDGRDVTAQAQAAGRRSREEKERKGEPTDKPKDGDLMQPFSRKWAAHYRFELVRREVLWGHPTYVVRVRALDRKQNAGDGFAWIDADRFVELKGEFVPARLPDRADWAKFQLQYAPHASGIVLPSFIKFEGGGHMWFVKKGFRQTLEWHGCR